MKRSSQKMFEKKSFWLILLTLGLALAGIILWSAWNFNPASYKSTGVPQIETPSVEQPRKEIKQPVIKDSAVISVPYTVQAPLANWNIHENSCEEAAILMYHYFLDKLSVPGTVIPAQNANIELTKMVDWQKSHYGREKDLTLTETGQLAKDYYGYNFEVKKNITADDIKLAISEGHLVVVPVMTQSLQNSHYSAGNVYHELLIKGYDSTGVITNDAGVKEGENWHYTWEILWNAIDAQTPKLKQGRDLLIFTK
jgi:hypothetical protein